MTWNPAQYLAFADHRARPAIDLLARVPLDAPDRVADLGCGPGNSTGLLLERWPYAEVAGVDSSPEMLERAQTSGVRARWQLADIDQWSPDEPCDLIFSNAALHWVPDHERLLPRLIAHLRPGGVLAIQMPRNFDAPSHALMREIALPMAPELQETLLGRDALEPEAYYDVLAPHAAVLDLWTTTYVHSLDGEDPVLRWTRATGLRPIVQGLSERAYTEFEAAYAARLREAYPKRPDGKTLFPFKRLFLIAVRAG